MQAHTTPTPLEAILQDLAGWLESRRVPWVLVGGIAASFLGRPRFTRDLDVLVLLPERDWEGFGDSGATYGFLPRLSDALAFARKTRVLLMRHQPTDFDLDLIFGSLPFEQETVARAKWKTMGKARAPLPTPEDLIILKAVARRPQDLMDIEGILDAHPKLNRRRIRQWLEEFAAALEQPELLKNWETLLSRRRLKPKK